MLIPGKRYRVRIALNGCAPSFPAGHRLRLSLSTSYFPLAWTPPLPVRLTIYPAASHLCLPTRRAQPQSEQPGFLAPEGAPPIEKIYLERPHNNWWVKRDLANDVSTLEVINNPGWIRIPEINLEFKRNTREWYSYCANEFDSPRGETLCKWSLKRADWQVETITRTIMTCDAQHFYIHAQLDAYEGETRVYSRNWNETVPRKLV